MRRVVRKDTKSGDVRIISGFLKGRKVGVIDVTGLRPTSDRIRETLFNWLQMDVVSANCLDLFAGTGALGIEAISRGAESVTFVENSRDAFSSLEKACNNLSIQDSCNLIHGSGINYLQSQDCDEYDIIFIDPPFDADLLPNVIESLFKAKVEALIYLEDSKDIESRFSDKLEIIKSAKAGKVYYALAKVNLE